VAKAEVELLINTKSRRGREALPAVLKACEELGIAPGKVHEIKDVTKLPAVLRSIRKRSPKMLIVGSGDGTASEVVDYLAETDIRLGIVPLGTTNNFARSLGIPLDIHGAIKALAAGRIHKIDLGQIHDDYFANVTGIGLSARLAQAVSPKLKKRYGRFAYAVAGALVLFRHKPFTVTVEDKDGELQLHFETHQVIVANGKFHAGRHIAAGAKLDSRELVIFKLGGPSKFSFLWHMFDFYFGKRKSVYHSSYLLAKDVTITTNTPQPVELDGEVKYTTPVRVKVHPRAIKIVM